jgi:hypothetical protein
MQTAGLEHNTVSVALSHSKNLEGRPMMGEAALLPASSDVGDNPSYY